MGGRDLLLQGTGHGHRRLSHVSGAGGRDLLQLAGQERHRRVLRGVRRSGPFPRYSKALGRADDLRGPRPDGSRLFQLSVPICQGIGKKKIPLIHTQFIISD